MRRIGAAVLDTIFIYILYVLVTVALSVWGLWEKFFFVRLWLLPALTFLYNFLFDFFAGGMTYGKMIMKLQVEFSGDCPRWKYALLHRF